MEKEIRNNVHLFGQIASVKTIEAGNSETTKFMVKVRTVESYKKDPNLPDDIKENWEHKPTFHDVSIICGKDDRCMAERLVAVGEMCELNAMNYNRETRTWTEGYTPTESVNISLDGKLISYNSVCKDENGEAIRVVDENGKAAAYTVEKNQVIAPCDSIIIGRAEKAEKEARNHAEIVGNVAKVSKVTGKTESGKEVNSYILRLANSTAKKVFVEKDGKKTADYEWLTSFFDVRVTKTNAEKENAPKLYEKLENGEIEVGDTIRVSGMLHNQRFTIDRKTDAMGNPFKAEVYKMTLDASYIDMVQKKSEKESARQEENPGVKPGEKPAVMEETEEKPAVRKARTQKIK